MKRYSEEYFSVINSKTGKKLADCGDELDALALVAFNPDNRIIVRNKFLMSPVIDIKMPKSLPTTNVTVSNVKEGGCTTRKQQLLDSGTLRLKEDQRIPFNAK